jgi:hypothetical protein
MNPKILQLTGFVVAGLLVPLSVIGQDWFMSSKSAGVAFFATAYLAVVASVSGAVVLYRREKGDPLPNWRRIPYASGLTLLSLLCLVPLATWPIAFSGTAVAGARAVVVGLFVINLAAAVMICFGRGWSRVGLVVVSYWILFLWMFPLALRE